MKPLIRLEDKVRIVGPHFSTAQVNEILAMAELLNDPSLSRYHDEIRQEGNKILEHTGLPVLEEYLAVTSEMASDYGIIQLDVRLKTMDSIAKKVVRADQEDLNKIYEMTGKISHDYGRTVRVELKDTCGERAICHNEAQLRALEHSLFKRFGVDEADVKDYIAKPKASTGYKAVHAVTRDGVELQLRTAMDHARAENDIYHTLIKRAYETGNTALLMKARRAKCEQTISLQRAA